MIDSVRSRISDVHTEGLLALPEPAAITVAGSAGAVAAGGLAALAARTLHLGGAARWMVPLAAGALGALAGAMYTRRKRSVRPEGPPRLPTPTRDPDELRVMTINIHKGVPDGRRLTDANERLDALRDVAQYIADIDADIVLVQEIDDDVSTPGDDGGIPNQLELLGRLMDAGDVAFAASAVHAKGDRYGIATYTRNGITIEASTPTTLPHSPDYEARQMLLTELRTSGGGQLTVTNTHLDHTGVDRPAQLVALRAALAGKPGHVMVSGMAGQVVAGGDLNANPDVVRAALQGTGLRNVLDSERVRGLADGPARDAARAASHVGGVRIDHLFTGEGFTVRDTWVADIPMQYLREGRGVTDHRAVVADLAWTEAG